MSYTNVLLSNMPWHGLGQTNRQAWALALAARSPGDQILFVETLGWKPWPTRVISQSLESEQISVIHAWNLFPKGGDPRWQWSRVLNGALTTAQVRWTLRSLDKKHGPAELRVIAFDPMSRRIVQALPTGVRLYDCLDFYAAQPQFLNSRRGRRILIEEERKLAAIVDLVSVSARGLLGRFTKLRRPAVYEPGAPMPMVLSERAARTPAGARILTSGKKLKAVYVGALDVYKVDFRAFHRLLDVFDDLELVVVGRAEHSSIQTDDAINALRAHARVTILAPVQREDLADVLRDAHIGIVAMAANEYSDYSFPLKFWDYLGHGVPVLSVGSKSLEDVPKGVVALSTPGEIDHRSLQRALDMGADAETLKAFALANSAPHRVDRILKELHLAQARDSGVFS